ncbi:MotA/TolQ/ExbB proton channel family protein [Phaeobacter sp. HF9A]|uniref:MotA/TolQ/ExbB proton channel family protein n=1 Tax=Phaeobacter sp. HF9A TaxID=2721561 RepID=UPI0014303D7C|nr:MotA/TolQ/ExbB proton channel family protein [Phaeobacter sp. HF9A]NIZ12014.1 MotA/TolQ/ExbB proton channel family protein [Phaeobacter sp. HF9A]
MTDHPARADIYLSFGFSALALLFYGLGRGMVPAPLRTACDLLAGLALIAELARLFWQPGLHWLTAHLVPALAFVATLGGLLGQIGSDGAGLDRLQAWPLVLLCLAVWLPRMTAQAPRPVDGLVLGGALVLMLATALSLSAAALLPYLLQTPVHLCLWLAFLSSLALTLAAATGPLPPSTARFAAGLAGLLPLLGFFGTIFGLMGALEALPEIFAQGGPQDAALAPMLRGLGNAFETTLIGLGGAMVLTLTASLLPDAPQE